MLTSAPFPDYSLVVIDAAESSGCPSDGSDVNPWLAKMVDPWKNVGAGVVVLDHLPKQSDGRPPGPIGSQRKRGAVNGASLIISGMPWTKRKGGKIILKNDKDRGGDLPAATGQTVAVVVGTWQGEGDTRSFAYAIEPPQARDDQGEINR